MRCEHVTLMDKTTAPSTLRTAPTSLLPRERSPQLEPRSCIIAHCSRRARSPALGEVARPQAAVTSST